MSGFIKYKSYSFVNKDPIIDKVRTVVENSKKRHSSISADSGVAAGTLTNWFHGKTRRPQFATVNAVLRACGKTLVVANKK